MTQLPIVLIANPAAGRGRGVRAAALARAALDRAGPVDVRFTRGPLDEIRLAGEATRDGASTIIALGGDGTWGNVAHGILAATPGATADARPRLALFAAGTGNDFARSLGTPAHDYGAMADLIRTSRDVRVDVGQIDDRHFLNCLGFGFDARVVERARDIRWLGGSLLYAAVALPMLFGYRGVEIAEDAGEFSHHLTYVVANGRRFGGAFMVAPWAAVDDGMLDLVTTSHAAPLRRLALFARTFRGTHRGAPEIGVRTIEALRLRFRSPPVYQVDGEFGVAATTEVVVRCLAGALRMVAASPAR